MASIFKRKGAAKYTIKWTDHTGKRREQVGYRDKAKTKQLAAKLEDEARQQRDGLVDPVAEERRELSRRPVDHHLSDYENYLQAAGRDDQHIRQTVAMVRRIAEDAGISSIAEIDPVKINLFAAQMATAGRAARTIQAHVTAMKAFAAWLVPRHA